MNIGTQILKIRKEKGLTQEEFGKIFHVTRQTVSNWENEKSYPDLQILIDISNRFDISLDVLILTEVLDEPAGTHIVGNSIVLNTYRFIIMHPKVLCSLFHIVHVLKVLFTWLLQCYSMEADQENHEIIYQHLLVINSLQIQFLDHRHK